MKSNRKTNKQKLKNKPQKETKASLRVKDSPQAKWIYICLFLFSFLLYSNTINHKYAFDDSIVITENEFTKQGVQGIPSLLSKDMFEGMYGEQLEITGGRYRPLSLLTFALEYEFFGKNPKPSHIFNILYYSLLVVLLYIVLKLITSNSIIALVATLLFAAHPIHTEVVANIKSRDEILCLLFGLVSLLSFLKNEKGKSAKWLIIGLISFYISLLAKETAVVFIILIPAALYIKKNRTIQSAFLKSFIPLAVVFSIYFIVRTYLVGMPGGADSKDIMENPFVNANGSEKVATIFFIMGKYLKLMLFPHPLSCDYSFNQIPVRPWNIESVFWLLIYFSVLVSAVVFMFRKSLVAYALLFYLLPLSITSNLLFNIGAPMGERFAFISSVGFCLIIAFGLQRIFAKDLSEIKWPHMARILMLVLPVLILYSWKTIDRNNDWKDNQTLFSVDAVTVPSSSKIHYYYGNTVLNRYLSGDKKDKDKLLLAKREFAKSVKINPKFHWAHFNLGKAYDYLHMPDSAIFHLEKVLESNPTHISTQSILGSIYGKDKNDYPKAIYYLNKSIEYQDYSKSNYHNLAIAYALSGNTEMAVKNFKEALKYAPDDARLNYELGLTLQNLGNYNEANSYLNQAYRLDPSLKEN